MNQEKIEQWLEEMPLLSPSPSLDERVLALSQGGGVDDRWRLSSWTGSLVGLAAGLAIAVSIWGLWKLADRSQGSLPGPGSAIVSTIEAEGQVDSDETLVETTDTRIVDDGLVVVDNQVPLHQIRRLTTRQLMYYNQKTNERLEIVEPGEQVIFIAAEPL